MTAEQARELVEAYLAGDSTYVLARRFGIHRETVSGHLERAGVARRGTATRRPHAATHHEGTLRTTRAE